MFSPSHGHYLICAGVVDGMAIFMFFLLHMGWICFMILMWYEVVCGLDLCEDVDVMWWVAHFYFFMWFCLWMKFI